MARPSPLPVVPVVADDETAFDLQRGNHEFIRKFATRPRYRGSAAGVVRARPVRVSEIARLVGVKPHVVRYYVRAGLLEPRRTAGNGYKKFLYEDVTRLRCIRAARSVGMSITEISGLLDKVRNGGNLHAEMRDLVLRKHAELTARHKALGQTLEQLCRLRALCEARDPVCRDLDSLCEVLEQSDRCAPEALSISGF